MSDINKNMEIYNKVRSVPSTAQKTIIGGRLKGFTDINPMWRIEKLTEIFGVCGFGWKYNITNQKMEAVGNEVCVFIDIELFVKINDSWSEAIIGIGGNRFASNEKNGTHVSDECFKMALTDAIGVACKALGMGADIYYNHPSSKYNMDKNDNEVSFELSEAQIKRLHAIAHAANIDEKGILDFIKKAFSKTSIKELTKAEYNTICNRLETAKKEKEKTTKSDVTTEDIIDDYLN